MQQNQCLYLPSSGSGQSLRSGAVTAEKPRAAGVFGSVDTEHQRTLDPERLGNTRRICVSQVCAKSWNVPTRPVGLKTGVSLFLMSGVLLAGCDSAPPAPAGPRPTVARICRDGSYIYRHADGTYWAWNGYRIDDIDKVCDR
jgi:hypothetical protein